MLNFNFEESLEYEVLGTKLPDCLLSLERFYEEIIKSSGIKKPFFEDFNAYKYKEGRLYGVKDFNNKTVIKADFSNVTRAERGFSVMEPNLKLRGVLNDEGRPILPYDFRFVESTNQGIIVEKDDDCIVYDVDGNEKFSRKNQKLTFEGNYIKSSKEKSEAEIRLPKPTNQIKKEVSAFFYGLYNLDGEALFETEYDSIKVHGNIALLSNRFQDSLYNLETKQEIMTAPLIEMDEFNYFYVTNEDGTKDLFQYLNNGLCLKEEDVEKRQLQLFENGYYYEEDYYCDSQVQKKVTIYHSKSNKYYTFKKAITCSILEDFIILYYPNNSAFLFNPQLDMVSELPLMGIFVEGQYIIARNINEKYVFNKRNVLENNDYTNLIPDYLRNEPSLKTEKINDSYFSLSYKDSYMIVKYDGTIIKTITGLKYEEQQLVKKSKKPFHYTPPKKYDESYFNNVETEKTEVVPTEKEQENTVYAEDSYEFLVEAFHNADITNDAGPEYKTVQLNPIKKIKAQKYLLTLVKHNDSLLCILTNGDEIHFANRNDQTLLNMDENFLKAIMNEEGTLFSLLQNPDLRLLESSTFIPSMDLHIPIPKTLIEPIYVLEYQINELIRKEHFASKEQLLQRKKDLVLFLQNGLNNYFQQGLLNQFNTNLSQSLNEQINQKLDHSKKSSL